MSRDYIFRTREAGPLIEVAGYPIATRADSAAVRRAKQRTRDEIVKAYNHKTSAKLFALKLAANFPIGSIVGCVTYDDRHLPPDRKKALRRLGYFRGKIAEAWRARGEDPAGLVWAFATEEKHGDGRLHHHFVCPALGDDYGMLRAAWGYGEIEDFKPLRVDAEKNYDTLAAYFAKEGRERLDLKAWNFSRNARRPVETRERVEMSALPEPPPGALVVETRVVETPFGVYVYQKYLTLYDKNGDLAVSPRGIREAARIQTFY